MTARRRKRSSRCGGADARDWAIASARWDREIVSSARLILVISKRVSDLSADPPDARSRAAGHLTRPDARLLQSPRSGTVAGGHALAAGIAQEEKRHGDWWIAARAATSLERCDGSLRGRAAASGTRPADRCLSSGAAVTAMRAVTASARRSSHEWPRAGLPTAQVQAVSLSAGMRRKAGRRGDRPRRGRPAVVTR